MKKFYLTLLAGLIAGFNFLNAQYCGLTHDFDFSSRGIDVTSSPANVAREAQYDVKFYFLDLNMERTGSAISGNVLVRGQVLVANMDTFALELDPVFTIDSVVARVNNGSFQITAFSRGTGTDLNILLAANAQLNDLVEVRIYYHGTASVSPNGNPTGSGYFTGNNANGQHIYSASPPYNSSTWWPCKQHLADKADSSWFFITTDTSNKAISNGLLNRTVDLGNGKRRWEWKSRYPINFYVICFAVGRFNLITRYFQPDGRTDSMPVEFYGTSPSYTVDVLHKFSNLFGLYPFYEERFALAQVQLGGGIENQTFVCFGPAPNVIEHEVAHQWWGNNVTCASYKDVWLNEGLARWAESLYQELISANPNNTRKSFCNQYESGSIYSSLGALGYPTSSIYHSNTDTVNFMVLYGGRGRAMNYEKGAMMINMLRFEIDNDSLFFRSLRNFQNQYGGGNATGNDFWDVVENTTGRDFSDFFNQWYLGYGHPLMKVRWNHRDNQLHLRIDESTSSPNTPLFKTSLQLEVKRLRNGVPADTLVRLFIAQNVSHFNIPSGDSVTGIVVDPNQWLLNKADSVINDTALFVAGVRDIENEAAAYTVYPNPTTGFLNIKSHTPVNGLLETELYNAMGQRVHAAKLQPYEQLALPALPGGMYLLLINGSHWHKVSIIR